MRRALSLVATALGAAALALVAGACNPVNPYAALVNGQAISQTAVNVELQAIRNSPQYMAQLQNAQVTVTGQGESTYSPSFVSQVLSRQIGLKLVSEEVQARHIPITADDLAAAEQDVRSEFSFPGEFASLPRSYQQTLIERQAEVTALEARLSGVKVDSAAVAAYYQEHRAAMVNVCVQHILVTSQAEAQAIKAQLDGGADFAQLAQADSIDQGSASAGGQLGCGPAAQYVPQFARAVETLPLNVVSDPVQSQYGWHIIEVTARSPLTLAQAAPQIRQQLLSSAGQSIGDWLARGLARADIVVDPRYGHFSVAGGQPTVIPPTPPNPSPR
ncbi:MAG TPA: peptidylprolyl isomerase [Acidimicrobiales bacterium]|nr:peptidylprolyl isomerase [Acidimicrobiales bacterium]